MTSLSSIISSGGGAFSTSSVTTKASDELQSLFAKLHMDAIASTSTASTSAITSASTGTTPTTKKDVVTGLVSGLRSVLDGTVSAASAARSVGKLAASYGSGVGLAGLAAHAVDKLA